MHDFKTEMPWLGGFSGLYSSIEWNVWKHLGKLQQCREMRFATFLSGGFITMVVINPPEKKLAKHTSVQCRNLFTTLNFFDPIVRLLSVWMSIFSIELTRLLREFFNWFSQLIWSQVDDFLCCNLPYCVAIFAS